MKSNTVDVFIYVQAKEKPEIVSNVLAKIAEIAGVVKASINPRVKHLLAIEYNPEYVSGRAILNIVRQSGCTASLVGM